MGCRRAPDTSQKRLIRLELPEGQQFGLAHAEAGTDRLAIGIRAGSQVRELGEETFALSVVQRVQSKAAGVEAFAWCAICNDDLMLVDTAAIYVGGQRLKVTGETRKIVESILRGVIRDNDPKLAKKLGWENDD